MAKRRNREFTARRPPGAIEAPNHLMLAPLTMETTVRALLTRGKGILAADESFPTLEKRFKTLNVASTETNRLAYREMLFTAPGLGDFISGVILFDETIRQRTKDNVAMPEVLTKQGIIPGIKVDRGTIALAQFAGEKITQGLDGLRERLFTIAPGAIASRCKESILGR